MKIVLYKHRKGGQVVLANIIVFDVDFQLRRVFHLGRELPVQERRVDSG